MTIAYGSDFHLTRWAWKSRPDLDGDSFRALADLSARLRSRRVSAVIIGGDIFDARRADGPELEAFTHFVDELYTAGIPVYFIQGNHDRDPLKAIPTVVGAVHLHKQLVVIDGQTVYGLDSMTRDELQEALKTVPPCDYLVLHQMAEHLIGFEAAADFTLDQIPVHVRNVLVGDIHIPNVAAMPQGHCVSAGCLHPCSIAESGEHGVYLLDAGKAPEWMPVLSREILRYSVKTAEEFEAAASCLPQIQSRSRPQWEPIVELRYVSAFADTVHQLVIAYPQIKIFTKPIPVGKIFGAQELQDAQQSFKDMSLMDALVAAVDPVVEKEKHDFLASLLTGNAKAIIEQKVKEACAL